MTQTSLEKKLAAIAAQRETITKINLSEISRFADVPILLKQCPAITDVDLSYTDIVSVPDWLVEMPNLRRLRYDGCSSLKQQPNLGLAEQLTELGVQINEGQSIPDAVFTLPHLGRLELSGELDKLPDGVGEMASLESLGLLLTKITTLPETIAKSPKLKSLALKSFFTISGLIPDATQIISTLTKCHSLTSLDLSMSGITTLPLTIGALANLTSLKLNKNQLTDYPEELHRLTKLTELDFGVNKLSSIKPGFGALRKLKVLRLNSNWTNKLNVTNLWNELDQLSDLRNLQLWSCQSVTSIPGNVSTLSKLQELDVDNNLLVDLPESLFTMTHLKKLRVSTNKSPTATTDRLVAALPSTKVVL
jgi:Leucine-rich repeat (LRR) protein